MILEVIVLIESQSNKSTVVTCMEKHNCNILIITKVEMVSKTLYINCQLETIFTKSGNAVKNLNCILIIHCEKNICCCIENITGCDA